MNKKLIKTEYMDFKGGLPAHKSNIHSVAVTSNTFGTEFVDNFGDYKASEVTITVSERWSSGDIKYISFEGDSVSMSEETALDKYIRFPLTPYDHYDAKSMTGVRGCGKKLEEAKGYSPKTYFSGDDGYVRLLEKTPCYDYDGKDEADLESLSTFKYEKKILCDRVDLYKTDIKNEEMFPSGNGLKIIMLLWEDCPISDIKLHKIESTLRSRYSMVKNFRLTFIDETTGNKSEHKTVFMKLLNKVTKLPVTQYTDFNRISNVKIKDKKILARLDDDNKKPKKTHISFDIYWEHTLHQNHDRDDLNLYETHVGNGTKFRPTGTTDSQAGMPQLNILGSDDVIVWSTSKFWTSFTEKERGLILFLKPKFDIREFLAREKAMGFSDGYFKTTLFELIRKTIRDNKIRAPYWNSEKKKEDAEVEVFVDRMVDGNPAVRQSFMLLDSNLDEDELVDRNSYILREPIEGREIDLQIISDIKKTIELFEFQASTVNSDQDHCDGILSRIAHFCSLDNDTYRNFYWVAKKHKHVRKLKKLLKSLRWENTVFENVYFLTHTDIENGFRRDKIMRINIKKDILK
tara:strand:+ start:48 stop:1769 length:1722 start_codon:yes stop_codon:yes gene_type:complete